jgi:hypothetical protein
MKHRIAVFTVFNVVLLLSQGFSEVCAEEVTIEDVLQMWSAREAATETCKVHWLETVARRAINPETRELDVPVVEEREVKLWIGNGPNVRYESIPVRDATEQGDSLVRPGLAVSTFDGRHNWYYTAATGPDDHHRGLVFEAEAYDEIMNYHLHAVMLCCRPSLVVASSWSANDDSGLVKHDATLRIVERDATFAGRSCLVIESTVDGPVAIMNQYWVDIERDGLILQHIGGTPGNASTRLTIEFEHDNEEEWVPASWDAQFLNGTMSTSASVVDITLNDAVSADMFEIAYPPGTVVADRVRGEQLRVLPDGTAEVIRRAQVQADDRVKLPIDSPREDTIVVNIGFHPDSNEAVVFDGDRSIPVLESAEYFQREARQIGIAGEKSPGEVIVVIRAAATVSTGLIQEMIRIAEDSGFARFLLKSGTGDETQPDVEFDINMPIAVAESRNDTTTPLIPVRLTANDDGSLQQVYFGANPLGNDAPACFQRLNDQMAGLVGAGGDLADDAVVEIDAAYDLDYQYTVKAVSSCLGRIDPVTKRPVRYVSIVRFTPPERGTQ